MNKCRRKRSRKATQYSRLKQEIQFDLLSTVQFVLFADILGQCGVTAAEAGAALRELAMYD